MERWQKVTLLTFIYFSYLMVGTLVFQSLERGEEENLRMRVRTNLETFLVNNTCVDVLELRMLVNEVVNAYSSGLRFEETNITSFGKHLWDFSNSLFFATTVITRIGYGNMTPSTTEGKWFCMLFAIVGIPLTGIFASLMGNQLESHWTDIIKRLNKSLLCIKRIRLRKSIITLCVGMGLYFLIVCVPAIMINEIEGWGWFISHYYALISISTIGFGDFVAGNGSKMTNVARVFYKLALVIYFVFGFVILTIIFKKSQQIHDKQVKNVRRFTSSVKDRLRRTSMFPSQSSTRSTPRDGSVSSRNGDFRRGKVQKHHPSHSRRKLSPNGQPNGHVIKRPYGLARTRKAIFSSKTKSKNKSSTSSQQEIVLNISNNSISYNSKDLSTVVDGNETVSISDLRDSQDELFTVISSPQCISPAQGIVNDYAVQNLMVPQINLNSQSLQDVREMTISTPNMPKSLQDVREMQNMSTPILMPRQERPSTSAGDLFDGFKTL